MSDGDISVVGAGMAGLLTAAMLRSECAAVYERQPSLPNNHNSLLRFRTHSVGDVLNINFKPVQVNKCIEPWRNPVADALSYSRKTTGGYYARSITHSAMNTQQRYIAPPDLINRMRMAVSAPVEFNAELSEEDWKIGYAPIISTIPMPMLMDILGYSGAKPDFESHSQMVLQFKLSDYCAYSTVYLPDPIAQFSRVSITGDLVIAELSHQCSPRSCETLQDDVREACSVLGVDYEYVVGEPVYRTQPYGKIVAIEESARKRFMLWATEQYSIYSIGRYATWRPGLLLDDVVNDIRVVHRMIRSGSTYEQRKPK